MNGLNIAEKEEVQNDNNERKMPVSKLKSMKKVQKVQRGIPFR